MGYLHIDNLYKNQDILLFKECYAMEKIHGTSAHLSFDERKIGFFSGGEKHEKFINLFDHEALKNKFEATGILSKVMVYGEAYGGRQQGMKATYGDSLKFIAFDVRIGECWLDVPKAHELCKNLGIDFVWYTKTTTDLGSLDQVRDKWSEQAIRNGILEKKIMEGIVLRPLIEVRKNNGARIIAKHKREEFRETNKTRKVIDPAKLKVLADAKAVAEEWVTLMRLNHVLDKIELPCVELMGDIIKAIIADIKREGEKEIVWSKAVEKAIGKATAKMTIQYFKSKLKEGEK